MEKIVIDNINKRLDVHGHEIDGIEKCLERLTVITERMDNTESDHEQRIRDLENHGGEIWDKVVMTAISAIVGGLVAFVLVSIGLG